MKVDIFRIFEMATVVFLDYKERHITFSLPFAKTLGRNMIFKNQLPIIAQIQPKQNLRELAF